MSAPELSIGTAFIGLTAGFTAVAFMFQSRHHNLYEHEKFVQGKLDENRLRIAETKDQNEGRRLKERQRKLLNEHKWAKLRWNFALVAFIFLMLQVSAMLFAVCRYLADPEPLNLTLPGPFAWLWVVAFSCHIFGDLTLAFLNQFAIRRQLHVRSALQIADD